VGKALVNAEAKTRCEKRMADVDAMTPAIRSLVHEHGLTVVQAFIQCGVSNPRHIRHLIGVVRAGSVEIGNREGAPLLTRKGGEGHAG
jgi:hypothetical protein